MWSYFGAKTNLVRYYPRPAHGSIIEPFAGTARYALKYFDRDVHIVDRYKDLIDVWKWLQLCSPGDILKLPRKVSAGQRVSDYTFDCREAELLFSFLITRGDAVPKQKINEWSANQRPNFLNFSLKRIAGNLFKIKHWKIEHGTYQDIKNIRATWFIDPPYFSQGDHYKYGPRTIDYSELARWCLSRNGQIIVCEGNEAKWLPFEPLRKILAARSGKIYTEQIFYQVDQEAVRYMPLQLGLFPDNAEGHEEV